MRFGAVLVMVVALTACGGATGDEATTSPATTSGPSGSTTTSPPATTVASSTTVAPTTTTVTTLAPTAVPAGVSLVLGSTGFFGGWNGSGWDPDPYTAVGGESFQVFATGSPSTSATGGTPEVACEFLEPPGMGVSLDPTPWPPGSYSPFRPSPVAIAAGWDASPRLVEEIPPQSAQVATATQLLAARGVTDPAPTIVQAIRTDIDGDGAYEVFAVAEKATNASLNPAPAGDYSIAFARIVVDGEVQVAVLGDHVVTEQPEGWIQDLVVFRFDAFLDANDDGVDEVVVGSSYYEGSGARMFEWQGPDLGLVPVLDSGCGV